jgi:Zn ribbon nucleic-acid-binding protein
MQLILNQKEINMSKALEYLKEIEYSLGHHKSRCPGCGGEHPDNPKNVDYTGHKKETGTNGKRCPLAEALEEGGQIVHWSEQQKGIEPVECISCGCLINHNRKETHCGFCTSCYTEALRS